MNKKVSITARPLPASPEADKWINADRKKEPANKPHAPKRLTIEIEGDTHTRFKVQCAIHRLSMADEIRSMIEKRVAELEQQGPNLFDQKQAAQGS